MHQVVDVFIVYRALFYFVGGLNAGSFQVTLPHLVGELCALTCVASKARKCFPTQFNVSLLCTLGLLNPNAMS